MHRADTQRRCPACGAVVPPEALVVSEDTYACPSCWTRQKPEGELEQPIRLMAGDEADEPAVEIPDAGDGEAAPAATVGSELRAARVARGVTLERASDATAIPARYLAALEEDAPMSTYPARTYARSFLREYARALGLDEGTLVRRFDEFHGAPAELLPLAVVPEVPQKEPGRRRRVLVLVLAIAALAAIVVSFQPWTSSVPSALPSVPSTPQVVDEPAPPADAESPNGGGNEDRDQGRGFRGVLVQLRVDEDTWVAATVDGEQRVAETFEPGRSITLRARDELDLVLGNSSGVRLRVGGERVPLRADGEVVELSLGWNGSRVTGLP